MIKLPKLFSNFKKQFNSIFSYNKKTLILGISLGLFFCFFSFQSAKAADIFTILSDIYAFLVLLPGYLLTMPVRIPFLIIVIAIGVLGLVSSMIFTLAGSLLNWLIKASLSIKVVPGEGAFEVLNVGFEFTKDFANMFIILILAFIGLATILKMREYEAKKILPKLLMVALLINFTPVMVGFIVDIANLFTNFFFTAIIDSGAFTSINLDSVFDIVDSMNKVMDMNLNVINANDIIGILIPMIVEGIIMISFYSIATFVYLLVSLLFFARFVILWILVILAPIAFFSQILPESPTVKALFPNILHWNKWWETLIQWAVIGIPLGFFLYLSAFIINTINAEGTISIISTAGLDSPSFKAIIKAILGPMVAIFILIFGVMISVESMPAVAGQIIDRAKGAGKGLGKGLGKRTAGLRGRTAGLAARGLSGIAERAERLDKRLGKKGVLARIPVTAPLRWTTRAAERAVAPALLKYEAQARAESVQIPKEFEKMTTAGQKEQYIKSQSGPLRLALAAKAGAQLSKMSPEFKEKLIEEAEGYAGHEHHQEHVKNIINAVPDFATKKIKLALERDPEKRGKLEREIEKKEELIREKIDKKEIDVEKEVSIKYKVKPEDITAELRKKFIRDTAAAATHIEGIKPGDIEKISNPKSLAVRMGSHGWSPKVWQKFTDKFSGREVKELMDEPGGVNSAVTDRPSFESFCRKHSRSAKFLLFNRAGKELWWKGGEIASKEEIGREEFEKIVRNREETMEREIPTDETDEEGKPPGREGLSRKKATRKPSGREGLSRKKATRKPPGREVP